MKKIVFLSLALVTSIAGTTQVSVTNAYNANKSGDFKAAAGYIEQAMSDPKATGKEKTWRYRGDIYLNIANDPSLSSEFPNALDLAKESYFKNLELDKGQNYLGEVRISLASIQALYGAKAEKQVNADDYCSAAEGYKSIAEISSKFGIVDTAFVFNSGYCYDRCGNNEAAIASYQKCADLGYNIPDTYRYIAEVHLKMNNKDMALSTIGKAREQFPNDSELLRSEVNIYIGDEQYDKAEALLVDLTKADPKNEMFWYVLGITYDKLGKKAEEETAYQNALDINPLNYDVLFNLGALYFNQGLDIDNTCNEIPPRETAKYNECVAKATTYFVKAVDKLETAYNNVPATVKGTDEEKQLMTALKDAYYKAGRTDDWQRMKDLLSK